MAKALKWKSRNSYGKIEHVTTGKLISEKIDDAPCYDDNEIQRLQNKVQELTNMLKLIVNSLPAESQCEIAEFLGVEGRSNEED